MLGSRTLIATGMAQNEIKSLQGMTSNEAEDVSGRTSAEIEVTLYVRVASFDFLERATGAERQEQWSIKVPKTENNAGSGSIRVRKVTNLREPGAAVQYVLTSKLDIGKKGASAETPEQSTVDQFNIFKYLSDKGMLKDRYTYPVEGSDLVWEVDCFPKPGEMYHEWIKIDLEKWPRGKELPQLPMAVTEMINGTDENLSPEAQAKITQLYQDVFLIVNTKEPLATYIQGGDSQPGVAKEEPTNTGDNNEPDQKDPNAPVDDNGGNDGTTTGGDGKPGGGGSDGSGNADDPGKGKDGTEDGEGNRPPTEGSDDQSADDTTGDDTGAG